MVGHFGAFWFRRTWKALFWKHFSLGGNFTWKISFHWICTKKNTKIRRPLSTDNFSNKAGAVIMKTQQISTDESCIQIRLKSSISHEEKTHFQADRREPNLGCYFPGREFWPNPLNKYCSLALNNDPIPIQHRSRISRPRSTCAPSRRLHRLKMSPTADNRLPLGTSGISSFESKPPTIEVDKINDKWVFQKFGYLARDHKVTPPPQ